MSLTALGAYRQQRRRQKQLFQIVLWEDTCCKHSQVDRRRCLQRGFFIYLFFIYMPQCCQSSLLDFYNMSDLPTQHRQDDGCPVHSWKGGKFVCFRREYAIGRKEVHPWGMSNSRWFRMVGRRCQCNGQHFRRILQNWCLLVKKKKLSHSGVQDILNFYKMKSVVILGRCSSVQQMLRSKPWSSSDSYY